jgi:hypothetical protein
MEFKLGLLVQHSKLQQQSRLQRVRTPGPTRARLAVLSFPSEFMLGAAVNPCQGDYLAGLRPIIE